MESKPFVTVCDLGLHVRVGSEGFGSACRHLLRWRILTIPSSSPFCPCCPVTGHKTPLLLCFLCACLLPRVCFLLMAPLSLTSMLPALGCCTSACGSFLASSPVLHSPGCQPHGSPSCSHELPGSVFSLAQCSPRSTHQVFTGLLSDAPRGWPPPQFPRAVQQRDLSPEAVCLSLGRSLNSSQQVLT